MQTWLAEKSGLVGFAENQNSWAAQELGSYPGLKSVQEMLLECTTKIWESTRHESLVLSCNLCKDHAGCFFLIPAFAKRWMEPCSSCVLCSCEFPGSISGKCHKSTCRGTRARGKKCPERLVHAGKLDPITQGWYPEDFRSFGGWFSIL